MFRNSKRMGRWIAIALAIGMFSSAEALAKKPPKPPGDDGGGYNLLVLAPPDVQITGSYAYDLDEAGNAVGCYLDADGERNGFHYDRAENSWRLFGPGVVVFGLNNLGEMVGEDRNTGEGLYWSSMDAPPVPLDPLGGHSLSRGFNINDAGIIVGDSQGNYPSVPVAWRVDEEGVVSAPIELPFPEGDWQGSVKDLSEEADGISRVVGWSGADDICETAIQWEVAVDADGLFLLCGPIDLGSLGASYSVAYGVNSHGDVAGASAEEGGSEWAFVKLAGRPMQPLPGIRRATNALACGINDLGQIVGRQGYLFQGRPIFRAVLWPDAGSVIDLNKKVALGGGAELEFAGVINNAGHILAGGLFPGVAESDYDYVSCLLIPK
jgi:uncharacterized membrane protein